MSEKKVKVKILQRMAGPEGNFRAGSVVEVSPESARHLLASRQATEVDKVPPPEKAPVENSSVKTGENAGQGQGQQGQGQQNPPKK